MSLVLSGGPMYRLDVEMEANMTREVLGIGWTVAPDDVWAAVADLCGEPERVERLFKLRTHRADRVIVYSRAYTPTPASSTGWVDRGTGVSRESNYCIATDTDGIPVFFEPCYDINLDLSELRKMVDRIIGFGNYEPIVVLDPELGDADNLEVLVKTYISFVVPARRKTPSVKQMLSQVVRKRADTRSVRRHGDSSYVVYDEELTVVPRKTARRPDSPEEDNETAELELVSSADPRFQHVPMDERIVAWACLDTGGSPGEAREAMRAHLERLEAKILELDPYEAADRLGDVAGEFSRFFDVRVEDGELEVKIRQKAVTASLNREGIFVLLSHGLKNWGGVMQCYDCRNRYGRLMEVLRSNLTVFRGSGDTSLLPRMVVQFVASVLWCTAANRLAESDPDMTVPAAMRILDSVMVTGNGVDWQVTDVTPRCRRVMEALHVSPPKGDTLSTSGFCGTGRPEERVPRRSSRSLPDVPGVPEPAVHEEVPQMLLGEVHPVLVQDVPAQEGGVHGGLGEDRLDLVHLGLRQPGLRALGEPGHDEVRPALVPGGLDVVACLA